MKLFLMFFFRAVSIVLIAIPTATVRAQDFTGDGRPDLLWRRLNENGLWLWQMNGTAIAAGYQLQGTSGQDPWKIAGMADFGSFSNGSPIKTPDGKTDILWTRENADSNGNRYVAIWFMNNGSFLGATYVSVVANNGWVPVGAGDFGGISASGRPTSIPDGKPDIVLERENSREKGLWLMDGWEFKAGVQTDTTTPAWTIGAVGDFGSSVSNPKPDGKPDLVYVDYATGQLAIQFMNGITRSSSAVIWHPYLKSYFFIQDLDFKVAGTGQYSTSSPEYLDILVRHQTDGRMYVWQMHGASFQAEYPLSPQLYDTDYRMNTQPLPDSRWRINQYSNPMLSFVASRSPNSIRINILDHPLPATSTFTISRRTAGSGSYSLLVSGLTSSTYTDYTVAPSNTYEYQVSATGIGSLGTFTAKASLDLPEAHSRGRVFVILEQGLAPLLGSALDTFIRDLAGDGYTVLTKTDAPRHRDSTPAWDPQNGTDAVLLKSLISTKYLERASLSAVILLGHVTIPYSGRVGSDGHSDHYEAWASDAFYGDVVGPAWGQNTANQFTVDYLPSALEIPVGRIDFANLPAFGAYRSSTISQQEASLVRQYLDKNHKYRHVLAPYPLADRAIFRPYVNTHNALINAKSNSVAFFNTWPDCLKVGDPFRNSFSYRLSPYSCLLGLADGHATDASIYGNSAELNYTSQMIAQNSEPPVGFWIIHGSYFADFNHADNNLARSILAKPSYSLIVIPNSRSFNDPINRLQSMAHGNSIGSAFVSSINYDMENSSLFTWHRWLNIQGDPTLRLHPISPPILTTYSKTGSTITLNWQPGESGSQYHVYGSSTLTGPYEWLTKAGALSSTSWTTKGSSANKPYYMVRGVKRTTTGSGSFMNLSQGSIIYIP